MEPFVNVQRSLERADTGTLKNIADRVRWIATAMIDHANRVRPNPSGIKVGGHQSSSSSMVEIMVALWFHSLTNKDRVSVKPHASPVLHAINYLLNGLDVKYLETLRSKGGLQSYPSRLKDPDLVDFSTGSVGIGATAPIWAAISHRYISSHFENVPEAGRFISLLGDAELGEGAIWEALIDPVVPKLGELLWIVDFNRQSLDRVVPEIQISTLEKTFEAMGWQVVTLKWGNHISEIFARPGGKSLQKRLEAMSNEEYQRILRVEKNEIRLWLLADETDSELFQIISTLTDDDLHKAIRDLGGHDIDLLVDTFDRMPTDKPTVVFAYTIKGKDLPVEGHPANHASQLTESQMHELEEKYGYDLANPWIKPEVGTPESDLCEKREKDLIREHIDFNNKALEVDWKARAYKNKLSTQEVLGRFLRGLSFDEPEIAKKIVTCSPDVASSTNLGGWINKNGVWSVADQRNWFTDDKDSLLQWDETLQGQHIPLGIAEVNLVGLIGELGTTWSRWGKQLIPFGVLYDPFVSRALEPWSTGIYSGGQSILVGTPSGVTLSPEGGAHQSISTPSIGLEQPGCVYWEPAFANDLEWCMLEAMSKIGTPEGSSHYFRLSTRKLDQQLVKLPETPAMIEIRRRNAIAGGYRMTDYAPSEEDITLVGVGAIMPEVLAAAAELEKNALKVGIICLTSPDLVFRSYQHRGKQSSNLASDIVNVLFPQNISTPIVTVQDGHPHTLSFLAGIRGDKITNLGVTEFGESSDLEDAYKLHEIDVASIIQSALTLLNR